LAQQFVVPALPMEALKQPRVKTVRIRADEKLARPREESTVAPRFVFREI
jgi:hypothetical protein